MDEQQIVAWMTLRVAELSGLEAEQVAVDQPLATFGIDSANVASLSAELADRLDRSVDPILLFEFPTIEAIAAVLSNGAQLPQDSTPTRAPAVQHEAVAIVGMACRLPGAEGKDAFWRNLIGCVDAVAKPSEQRKALGADPTRAQGPVTPPPRAGLIEGIDQFDASFFRIAPAEAQVMDPQQRLLLEVSWEALEDGGIRASDLRGERVGVFVGISHSDYATRLRSEAPSAFAGVGNALSIAANRLSYFYDLRGPSLAIDTACSSSLAALHLALTHLETGECDAAMVAGVNLLLDPHITSVLTQAGMLAPDARCKPFDASANGYVRGEGCGVVILKPVARALADGDRIYAVIKGSALGQDGRSNGLTAPNPAAQEVVLKQACAKAGLSPASLDYVEAHGTGTSLGDPIEAAALSRVFCRDRPSGRPLLVGSVKSNIGHLEAAAGMAGLIKAAMATYHGLIPATLHFEHPNPGIDFAAAGIAVVAKARPWPNTTLPRSCGVSSFGFGGLNAHVILQQAPKRLRTAADQDVPELVMLSAKSATALKRTAARWARHLAQSAHGEALGDIAHTAARRRDALPVRKGFVADTVADLTQQLGAFAASPETLVAKAQPPRVLFVFPGQGEFWKTGLWSEFASDRLFWSTVRRCDEAVADMALGWSVETSLRTDDPNLFSKPDRAQLGIFVLQTALVATLRAQGVTPTAVIGHSLGEVAAACAAGALSMAQGARLALQRGQCMARQSQRGAALAMACGADEARWMIASHEDMAVAAVNAPSAVTVAGGHDAVMAVHAKCVHEGKPAHWVSQTIGFHSPLMDQPASDLCNQLEWLQPAATSCPFISSVTGAVEEGDTLDALYWSRNVRQTVRFHDALVAALPVAGDIIIEISPQPVLRSAIRASEFAREPLILAAHNAADRLQRAQLSLSARLYDAGVDVRRRPVPGRREGLAALPSYGWDHVSHWLTSQPDRHAGDEGSSPRKILSAPDSGIEIWRIVLGGDGQRTLSQHRVAGRPIAPATAHIAALFDVLLKADQPIELLEGKFTAPIVLSDGPATCHLIVQTAADGSMSADLYSVKNTGESDEASRLASHFRIAGPGPIEPSRQSTPLPPERAVSTAALYGALRSSGLDYGPAFQRLDHITAGDGRAQGSLSASEDEDFADARIDPRMFDAAMHLLWAAAQSREIDQAEIGMPVSFDRCLFWGKPHGRLIARAEMSRDPSGALSGNIEISDLDGRPFVELLGLRFASLALAPKASALSSYVTRWRPKPLASSAPTHPRRILILTADNENGLSRALLTRLEGAGHGCFQITLPTVVDDAGGGQDAPMSIDGALRGILARTDGRLDAVVDLRPTQLGDDNEHGAKPMVTQAALVALDAIKAVSLAPFSTPPRLFLVTSQVHTETVATVAAASVWGLCKAVPFENPALNCRCVDLGDLGFEAQVTALVDELLVEDAETEVLRHNGERLVRRIIRDAIPPPARPTLRPEATYLVTGANGALGRRMVGWLADAGARSILGLGRSEQDQASLELIETLTARGIRFEYRSVDIGDGAALEMALATPPSQIRGFIHAAGVLRDGPMLTMASTAIEESFRAKVGGLLNLTTIVSDEQLDFGVLFSSAAAVLGSPGQANYCAANAFLDAYAQSKSRQGRRYVSLGWGPWADGGMAQDVRQSDQGLSAGVAMVSPSDGLDFMDRVWGQDEAHRIVVPFELEHLLQYYPEGAGFLFFEELLQSVSTVLRSAGRTSNQAKRPEMGVPYVEPRTEMERVIAGVWQRALGIDRVGVHDGFFELGGDSVFGNQIVVEIGRRIGVSIEPSEAFQAFTVAELAVLAEDRLIREIEQMSEEEVLATTN